MSFAEIPQQKLLKYKLYMAHSILLTSLSLLFISHVPIQNYDILVHLICALEGINLTPGNLTHNFGDVHIYADHIEAVKEYVKKEPYPYPKLIIKNKKKKITDFEFSDLKLIGYKSHPKDENLIVNMVA